MPIPSPFFPRTSLLCSSMKYKEWAGYYAVCSYEVFHDMEYFAFRHSAGLLDITPLYKYRVHGPDAAAFLSRIMVRDIAKMKTGRVAYTCWCTDEGKVVDDGTVMRRDDNEFFVTSADPSYSWFSRHQRGYDVRVDDITEKVAGLALQGPMSREILTVLCGSEIGKLRYFRTTPIRIRDFEVHISRTGYTGDLGYELWVENPNALTLYDELMAAGEPYNIRPAGLDALDVTRVEAGLILKDVDYFNALHVLTDDRKSSPYEITLGWTVQLDREPFIGFHALKNEEEKGSSWCITGLEMSWPDIESLYARYGLPPEVDHSAWRKSIPIYSDPGKEIQIGYATSGTWSPILKKNIALATLDKKFEIPGKTVHIEFTVEHTRHTVPAKLCSPQFFNPERKRSNPVTAHDS